GHVADDVWLRNRLAEADVDRVVAVRQVDLGAVDEPMPRHRRHGLEHARIVYPTRANLRFDHPPPPLRQLVVARSEDHSNDHKSAAVLNPQSPLPNPQSLTRRLYPQPDDLLQHAVGRLLMRAAVESIADVLRDPHDVALDVHRRRRLHAAQAVAIDIFEILP